MNSNVISIILMYAVVMAILFVPMYYSNKRKNKKTKELLDNLKVGDKVITIGGIHGSIVSLNTETVDIKIDKGTKLTLSKSAIARLDN